MSWASFAEGFGASLGGSAAGASVDRLFGIPKPSGNELGQDAKDFYDAAFPGTNSWERLGTNNPAGAQVTADASQRTAQRKISGDLALGFGNQRTQRDLVDTQTKTQKEVAEINKQIAEINERATKYAADRAYSGSTDSSRIAGEASMTGAGIAAGATTHAAETHRRGTVEAAEIGERSARFVALTQKDSNLLGSAIKTEDPNVISSTMEEVGVEPRHIDTLKSDEVSAKIAKMTQEELKLLFENALNAEYSKYAEQAAKAKLNQEHSKNLYNFLQNWEYEPNGQVIKTGLFLMGLGSIYRGAVGTIRWSKSLRSNHEVRIVHDKYGNRTVEMRMRPATEKQMKDAFGEGGQVPRFKDYWP